MNTLSEILANCEHVGNHLLWKGATSKSGYGNVRFNGAYHRTHRLVWILTKGPIPDGLYVCHRCNYKTCCCIDHLFLGTQKANMVDCVYKGMSNAKLTPDNVYEIIKLYNNGKHPTELAEKFGVSKCCISDIIHNRQWMHLPERPTVLNVPVSSKKTQELI